MRAQRVRRLCHDGVTSGTIVGTGDGHNEQTVRVLGSDGEDLGVMPISEARWLAGQLGLDVVGVDDKPEADPPLVRLADVGKMIYERDRGPREVVREARQILREVVAAKRREARLAEPKPEK